jgi:hypothetical protein
MRLRLLRRLLQRELRALHLHLRSVAARGREDKNYYFEL